MQEYRVVWHQCPHMLHSRKVNFVQAESKEDAKAVIIEHIERSLGIEWFVICDVTEHASIVKGKVVS